MGTLPAYSDAETVRSALVEGGRAAVTNPPFKEGDIVRDEMVHLRAFFEAYRLPGGRVGGSFVNSASTGMENYDIFEAGYRELLRYRAASAPEPL